MKWHSVNIERLFLLLLPVRWRRIGWTLFLRQLAVPLDRLVNEIRYKMQHDGRVIYLEKVLNETLEISAYDPTDHENTKVVYIGAGEVPDEVYIYLAAEPDEPVWLDADDVYLRTQAELDDQYCDFTVVVPSTYTARETRIRATVDRYKLAGKKYKIRYT